MSYIVNIIYKTATQKKNSNPRMQPIGPYVFGVADSESEVGLTRSDRLLRSLAGQIKRNGLKNLKKCTEVYFITKNYHEFFQIFWSHFAPQKNPRKNV